MKTLLSSLNFIALFCSGSGATSTTIAVACEAEVNSSSVPTVISLDSIYTLNASDYVEVIAGQDTGGSLNVSAHSDYSPTFYMSRVG